MPGNDTIIINGLKDQATRFVRDVMPHLPRSTQGNTLIFGLFLVSQCAKEQGLHRTVVEEFLAAVANMLRQSTGKDPTPAIASTFHTLNSRCLARGFDLTLSSNSMIDQASGCIGGLASDLLELANEPSPSDARIQEVTRLLAARMTAMQSQIRQLIR
jgi:hypothetical protein